MKKTPTRSKNLKITTHSTDLQSDDRAALIQGAEGVLLAAIPIVLAFQALRFEEYENEKFGLLSVLVAVLLTINFLRIKKWSWRPLWKYFKENPLLAACGILLLLTSVSTLFSFSPNRSLWGSPSRVAGSLSLLIYIVLFWQSLQGGAQLRTALLISLTLIVIPICLWAIITFLENGQDRLWSGSTTGNANYLSSWLVMVLLFCSPQIYWLTRIWKRPFTITQIVALGTFALMALLIVITLSITSSRGALLGLGTALIVGILLFATLSRRKRLVVGTILLLTVGFAVYVIISRTVDPTKLQGVGRIFQPYDESRVAVWTHAANLLAHSNEPFQKADGSPDQWAALRSFIGYGPDTTEQLASHLGPDLSFSGDAYLDRLHNFEFDTIATIGWLGLAAWIVIYEIGLYLGLRWLGLFKNSDWWHWLLAQAIGIGSGIVIVPLLISQAQGNGLWPVGAALGGVSGILFWIVGKNFRQIERVPISARSIAVISFICILVAQWLDNQFGFVQIATQPLFWIMLGQLVASTRGVNPSTRDDLSTEHYTAPLTPNLWYTSVLMIGLFLIHTMGTSIRSAVLTHDVGSIALPFLLLMTLFVGLILSTAYNAGTSIRVHLKWAGFIGAVWLVFFAIKQIIVSIASSSLDGVLQNLPASTALSFHAPIQLLSLTGIILMLIVLIVSVGLKRVRLLNSVQIAVIVFAFLIGSAFYSWNYTASVLHRLGNGFAGVQDKITLAAGDMAFEAATQYTPVNTRLRLHWLYLLLNELQISNNNAPKIKAKIDAQTEFILNTEPFFNNSREWETFRSQYSSIGR